MTGRDRLSAATAVVRPAGPGDVGRLAEIARGSMESAWSKRAIAEELERELSEVFVADCGGRTVGFAIAWRVHDEGSLLVLAVDPDVRRRGIGRLLVEAAEESARSKGVSSFHLEVRRSNLAAQAFYRVLGYRETGTRPAYYPDSGEDAVLMRRGFP